MNMLRNTILLALLLCTSASARPLRDIRVMSYNIRHGAGMDDKLDLARTAAVIINEAPYFAAIQEVDSATTRSGGIDQAARIGELTGMHPTFGRAITFQGGGYGVMLLSREEPVSVKRIPLKSRSEDRVLLVCEFRDCVVACTHLSLIESEVNASADVIISEAKLWRKPFIVMGDWNTEPNSPFIARMKEEFTFLSNLQTPTFPADEPAQCIDYIALYRPAGRKPLAKDIVSKVVAEPLASDHRPVVASAKLRRQNARRSAEAAVASKKASSRNSPTRR